MLVVIFHACWSLGVCRCNAFFLFVKDTMEMEELDHISPASEWGRSAFEVNSVAAKLASYASR